MIQERPKDPENSLQSEILYSVLYITLIYTCSITWKVVEAIEPSFWELANSAWQACPFLNARHLFVLFTYIAYIRALHLVYH